MKSSTLSFLLLTTLIFQQSLLHSKAYFSDSTSLAKEVEEQLRRSTTRVLAAVYLLSNNKLIRALKEIAMRGVSVEIVVDSMAVSKSGTRMKDLLASGCKIWVYPSKSGALHKEKKYKAGVMHHKFAVIDDETVITGSFNWTFNATTKNLENILIIKEPKLAREYTMAFERLKQRCVQITLNNTSLWLGRGFWLTRPIRLVIGAAVRKFKNLLRKTPIFGAKRVVPQKKKRVTKYARNKRNIKRENFRLR